MIIGIISVLLSLQLEAIIINRVFSFLAVCVISVQDAIPLDFKMPAFSHTPKVFHHPNRVLFNSRAFELEVFTDFPEKELKSVSLYYKTDVRPRFMVIPFDPGSNRYVYRYDPKEKPANQIIYFFTVSLKNGAVYATPIDSLGTLKPIMQHLVDPVEYYKQRATNRN